MSESSYEFDHIPGLDELFAEGGLPGVTYVYVAADRAPTFRKQGLKPVMGMEIISIQGHATVVLCHGTPVKGVSPMAVRSKLAIDRVLLSRIKGKPEEPVAPPVATFPKPGPAVPETTKKESPRAQVP